MGGVADAPALPDIDGTKRKRKKSKSLSKPTLTIGLPNFGMGANPSQVCARAHKGQCYQIYVRNLQRIFTIRDFYSSDFSE